VFQEIGEDIKAMREAGIPDEFIMMAMGQKMTAPAKTEDKAPAHVE
jgi:hypothetical protein